MLFLPLFFFPYQFIVNNVFILGALFVLKFNLKEVTDYFNEKLVVIDRSYFNFSFDFDHDD